MGRNQPTLIIQGPSAGGKTLLQQQEHAGTSKSAGQQATLWSIVMT
jgi:hypothetical protein